MTARNLFYPNQPGYKNTPSPSVAAPPPTPKPLPDALLGQKWAFVTLEVSAFKDLPEWDIDFGEAFPLELADVEPDTPVPGLLIFSSRATALAGWMSGLEMGYWRVETGKTPRLILETGAAESWILANLSNPGLLAEAQAFETAKGKADQVHFIGGSVQPRERLFSPGSGYLKNLNLG